MVEPEKPFACTMPDCGMTFTNEDHLNVHTKKHDMVLQFGCEPKAAFVADQTPTPTRFIRNCEEVGLFQDLQNVNPFDEGFKRAIETKQGILSLDHGCPSSEELHTPQMFPLLDPGDSVFTTNNHRNITISRSSSDETGAIKEFETTRISKLTNEVTTISRIVEKHDDTPKHKETLKNSVSYTNNVIKIQSNVIRQDTDIIEDVVIKDGVISKDLKNTYDRLQVPIMSQKSIDFVVDSCLTTDFVTEKGVKDATNTKTDERKECRSKDDGISQKKEVNTHDKEDYEVILKLPSGQQIKLVSADEKPKNTKDLLKKAIKEKVESQKLLNGVNFMIPTITGGTLIPVTIVNTNLTTTSLVNTSLAATNLSTTNLTTTNLVNANLLNTSLVNANLAPTTLVNSNLVNANLVSNVTSSSLVSALNNTSLVSPNLQNTNLVNRTIVNTNYTPKLPLRVFDKRPVRRKFPENVSNVGSKKSKDEKLSELESRSAASKRYRKKLKETMENQALENKQLREINEQLVADKALLQMVIMNHMKKCPCPDALRDLKEKLKKLNFKVNL